jgi:lipoprotein-anchoring transpeptidase ErfK/SrfK
VNNKVIGTIIGIGVILVIIFALFAVYKSIMVSGPQSVKTLIQEGKLDEAKAHIDDIALKNPGSKALGKVYFDIAKSYEERKDYVKARDIYQAILAKYQNIENILEVQESVGRLNIKILFSPTVTVRDVLYEVEPGDTLFKIAKKLGTTIDIIKASNSLKGDTIQARSRLKISKAGYKILIDKSQNILTLFFDDNTIFKVYRISTGENNSTPIGTFKITNKIKDPVWYTEGAIVPAESPDNILGSRWLGLSAKGYGIHGTIDPESVGRQATKGCIRMLNADVEELYTIIPVGTDVTIVD